METFLKPADGTIARFVGLYASAARLLDLAQPITGLVIRLYIASVFFGSGMIKVENWSGTLALFDNDFHVPVLPPHVAAVTGTMAELGLPVFLVLGLGTRAAAIALFIFNAIAVISYPDLSVAGLKDHVLWGSLLLVLVFYGPGKLALDHWIGRRFGV